MKSKPAILLCAIAIVVASGGRAADACDDTDIETAVLGIAADGTFVIEERSSGGAAAENRRFTVHDGAGQVVGEISTCRGIECDDAARDRWLVQHVDEALVAGKKMPTPAQIRRRVIARYRLRPARRSRVPVSVRVDTDSFLAIVSMTGADGKQRQVGERSISWFGDGPPRATLRAIHAPRSSQIFVILAYRSRGGGCWSRVTQVLWFPRSWLAGGS